MPTHVLGPVSSEERIPLLDALRGFALCGILVINIKVFSGFGLSLDAFPDAAARLGPGTDSVELLTKWFVDGKFYSIFSFLFGLGFSIQLARSEGKPGWLGIYARRLRILLLFGLVHAFLLWFGDILWFYSLAGFALLAFRNLQPRTILIWAAVFLLLPIPFYAASYSIAPGYNTDNWVPNAIDLPTLMRLVPTAGYPVALGLNLEGFLFEVKSKFFGGRFFSVLGMFLLGLCAGRLHILHEAERHRTLLKRFLLAGLAVGLAGSFASATMPSPFHLTVQGIYRLIAYVLGVHPLALAYIGAFALLWQYAAGRQMLSRFVPMGRMALSNYLMQTVLGQSIYQGYGLGWFGRMPTLVTMLVVLPSILLAQALLSTWWLRHFRYGPAEWVWRQATYRRRLPLRIERPSEVVG